MKASRPPQPAQPPLPPFGHFDDPAREYVVTRPDTPLPWLNYLGQDELFGLCTNTAGGYTFWKDAKLRRLTRYRYNQMPLDTGGRYLYVRDGATVWNPGWKPVKTPLDRYECRHGLGYTRITGEKNGIAVEQLCFIPPGENTEIWSVEVRNTGTARKQIRLFSFVEFCLYEAHNDATNYQRTYSIGEVEVEDGAIYHLTEYRERRNHYTLFACTRPVDGFDTDRDVFVGLHNGLHEAAVPCGGACRNSRAHGWNPVGAHQLDLDLAPGETTRFAFLLAYVEQPEPKFTGPRTANKSAGRAILERYRRPGAVADALARVRVRWDALLANFQVACPDEHLQRMVNAWNPCQCMATFNLSRSASLFETGIGRGMGFRDSNQDLLGFVHMIPDRARQRILDIAATQLADGTCYHQYQPLTKKGNAEVGGGFNDDPLWLILSTCAYIRETGDRSILDEPAGYADRPGSRETLLHHLETSLAYTLRERGPHRLPLIGHADWNDCLNLNCFSTEPNESFQTAGDIGRSAAESVMIAGLFLYVARELAALYDWLGRPADAARCRAAHADMLAAVEQHGWDGEWFLRAYDAQGNKVGSRECAEGRIYIESQGWCVLGGAGADNGRARRALDSVLRHLFTPHGIVLQQPAYSTYHLELGEVSSYPPGYKENAGVFSHNNTWIQLALCRMGDPDRALACYHSICPSAKQDQLETYRCEPYVYAQMTAGPDAARPGEAKNSWLTGTAAWSWVVATQGFLGIQPDFAGLRIRPALPQTWRDVRVRRRFRGADYDIRIVRRAGAAPEIRVDGRAIAGDQLPLAPPGTTVRIEVTLA